MAAQTFQPIAPRPAPIKTEGLVPWIRANLFGNWQTSVGTIVLGGFYCGYCPNCSVGRCCGQSGALIPMPVASMAWVPAGVWWQRNTA